MAGTVYFIQGADGGPIKIGFTNWAIEDRLKALQTGSPVRLTVLAMIPGDKATEKKLHHKFRKLRVLGEWFKDHERIRNFIANPRGVRQSRSADYWEILGWSENTTWAFGGHEMTIREWARWTGIGIDVFHRSRKWVADPASPTPRSEKLISELEAVLPELDIDDIGAEPNLPRGVLIATTKRRP